MHKMEIRIMLDGILRQKMLKAYLWGNAANILVWSRVTTLVSIGGMIVILLEKIKGGGG